MSITHDDIRDTIDAYLDDMIEEFDADTDREELIDRITEEADSAWGELVKHGRIDQYTVSDLTETAAECAAIVEFAEENAWVADDSGLWEGLTYGVLAAIAYHSLENCFHQALESRGIDSNKDNPFA